MHVITRGDDIGGAQVYLEAIAKRLLQDGHQLLVITGTPGIFSERLHKAGIATVSIDYLSNALNPRNEIRAVRELVRFIRSFNPELVVLNSSKAGMIGRVAARLARKPAIFIVHGWSFTPGVGEPLRTVYQWIERFLIRWTARVICVSNHSRELALSRGFPSDKLVTVHNGLESTAVQLSRDSHHVDSAVMVARFAYPKDQASLIRAASRVNGLHLHFLGDGPGMDECQRLAEDLGIADRVHFHGYTADVAASLPAFDMFILLSRHEGFPLSTLEAMRARLPVIVSGVGGAPEAVEEGVTGFVVPNDDEDMLVDRLSILLADKAMRERMGNAGYERFMTHFTLDEMYSRTVRVYEDAITAYSS